MKLNQKLLIANLIVILIVISLLWFSSRIALQVSMDVESSKKIVQANQLNGLMTTQAEQYKQNAPRDYESYYRDVKVYYTNLQGNLDNLDELVNSIVFDYFNRNTTTNIILDSALVSKNNEAFRAMENSYNNFKSEIRTQIGDNDEEPRLEWASEFITGDETDLLSSMNAVNSSFDELVANQRKSTVTYNYWLMAIFALLMLALMVWFNKEIVNRIIKVGRACREVAKGDYGFKVRDDKNDEIGQLAHDFNLLSSHSNSIISIFEKLSESNSGQQSINLMRSETQSFVNSSHVFLLKEKQGKHTVDLISSNDN